MIVLTRLNGHPVAINPDLVAWVEVTPDTTVTFVVGDKIVVKEDLDTMIQRVIDFRRAINRGPGTVTDITARLRSGPPGATPPARPERGLYQKTPPSPPVDPRSRPRPSWSMPPVSSKPPPGGK